MGKAIYTGVSGVARNVTAPYIGVGGVTRNVKNGYIGVNGVARQFYSALDTTLDIIEANDAGYWSSMAFFGRWLYNEDQEDGNTTYNLVQSFNSTQLDSGGYDSVTWGGTFYSASNDFLAYSTNTSKTYLPTTFATAFFCPSKNHADALVKCINNNYTKMMYTWMYWETLGVFTTVWRNISSVTSLGLCSDIGYKIYYTKTKYYDFSSSSYYGSKYVVEILTDNYLYCDEEKHSSSGGIMPNVRFA